MIIEFSFFCKKWKSFCNYGECVLLLFRRPQLLYINYFYCKNIFIVFIVKLIFRSKMVLFFIFYFFVSFIIFNSFPVKKKLLPNRVTLNQEQLMFYVMENKLNRHSYVKMSNHVSAKKFYLLNFIAPFSNTSF